MGIEGSQQKKESQPKFEFKTDLELQQKAEEIYLALSEFIEDSLARQTANYLLDAAKRMDETLKLILSDKKIQEDYLYDGQYFTYKKEFAESYAPNGYLLLKNFKEQYIEMITGYYDTNATEEDHLPRLQHFLEEISRLYIERTLGILKRYEGYGKLHAKLSDFEPIEVLSEDPDGSIHQKLQEEFEKIRSAEKIQKDAFFQRLEQQMKEK